MLNNSDDYFCLFAQTDQAMPIVMKTHMRFFGVFKNFFKDRSILSWGTVLYLDWNAKRDSCKIHTCPDPM